MYNCYKDHIFISKEASMIRTISYFVSAILFVSLAFNPSKAIARHDHSLFWMRGVPQSNYGNPALAPQPNFFIGLPLVSSIYLDVSNRGFMINDVLRQDMYNEDYWDSDHLLSQLKPKNHIQGSLRVDLLSFGLRHNDSYFFFHVSDKVEMNMTYTPDMAYLMFKGTEAFPDDRFPGNFDGLGTDYYHYREYAGAFTREWSPRLSTGIRAKILTGLAHASFDYQSMYLQRDPSDGTMNLYSEILIHSSNTSIPQILKEEDLDEERFANTSKVINYLTNSNNLGAAFDIGMIIKPAPTVSLGFCLLDLGFINWKDEAESVMVEGWSQLPAIDLQDIFEGNLVENFNQHADTASYDYHVTGSQGNYRQTLAPRFMASAAVDLSQRHQIAVLARGFYYNEVLYPSASVSYYARPSHAFGIMMSYTVANMNYSNIGFGFNLNLGPIQLYAISDNVLAAIQPNKAQLATLHFGMNLVFGYRPLSGRPLHGW